MRVAKSARTLLVATSKAKVLTWSAVLSEPEWKQIDGVIGGLARLGHVAAFSIEPIARFTNFGELLSILGVEFGDFVVEALARAQRGAPEPPPAYLMPVWPFDHEMDELPASTARFLSLDLEVCARPTEDNELGITLPNQKGFWLIGARPLHEPHFFGKVRATGH